MSEHDDIAHRLRSTHEATDPVDNLLIEAADEIERLRAKLAQVHVYADRMARRASNY